ncbi:DNA repair protein RecN [Polaribacter pacificus]|uniref:DNA repair protein RecN n=1 Tax=Polaribacter pacificus TaxID=1775173 RepID=A0A917I116_9FLAO|nr:DNA repair protein RecN [Polaribacter pacificus]GGH00261.1 DNA repair protein RecN [Polaribacter pacificus]
MLTKLSIQNYALINELTIDFSDGLSIITGETGAGKSILLGALGLVLGNRADTSALKDRESKCIVEAQLAIQNYQLEAFFEEEDLDYEPQTIIRREILPSGKSRAFVNDTPVTLNVLNALKTQLIAVHSQHQTQQLSDTHFQFSIVDALAKNATNIAKYQKKLKSYQQLQKEHDLLLATQREARQQHDYNLHLYEELVAAKLTEDEQEHLEEKLDKLNNIEEIKLSLSESLAMSTSDDIGLQSLLHSLDGKLQKIATYAKSYEELHARITSVKIEFDDIVSELEDANENVDFNPNQIEELNDRLQLLYNLQKKHYVSTNTALLAIQQELSEKVDLVVNADEELEKKTAAIKAEEKILDTLADEISKARKLVLPTLTDQLEVLLADLGMENARFSIQTKKTNNYFSNGKDQLDFLFSANKGGHFGELKKVASGGELSRVMLSVKKILSENSQLPTIIFDEIDTGVSGEVSNKIAHIMQMMAKHMQVITITHLPQIAAKGNQHYKVYKEDIDGQTTTNLKRLSKEERISEIAEMLGGKQLSDSAIIHAKELLN